LFPTTIWTVIREAGADDTSALDRFARAYEDPVSRYVRGRGFAGPDADDVVQEVFLRLLRGRVLEKADRERGRFRSLLLSVCRHVILDRQRRRGEVPVRP
jgi:RNA polymerase sigma-70 factor (ECF subfamily)